VEGCFLVCMAVTNKVRAEVGNNDRGMNGECKKLYKSKKKL